MTADLSPGMAPGERVVPTSDYFHELVRDRRLTPSQRRIARYLLEHRADAGILTSAELAERTSVSQPSVSRFAQALGFSGYPELRRYLHAAVTAAHARPGHRLKSTRFGQAVETEAANLRRLPDHEQEKVLAEAGEMLAASPSIVVLGLRASEPLARYLAFFASKIHPDVRLVSFGGSRAIDEIRHARLAGAEAMVCIALPRCPRDTVKACQFAIQHGLKIVTVTDDRLRPVAKQATVALTANVGTDLVFDSQAAPMLLVAGLLDAMAEANPTRTQERLEDFEFQAAAEEYFEPA